MAARKVWIIAILSIIIVTVAIGGLYYYNILLSQSGQVKIVDQADREVYVPRKISKVVSLWPEATRIIIALDAGDMLVGVCSADKRDPIMTRIYPQLQELPDLGDIRAGVNTEELVSLEPDVIFSDARSPEAADDLQKTTDIPVVCVRISLPPDGHFSFEPITLIGKVLNKEDKAEYLRNFLESELSKVTDVTSDIPEDERKTGYIAFARDPLITLGHVDPLESAGVINVATKGFQTVWYPVNIEQLIMWNPDIIIIHCLHKIIGNYTIEDILNDPQWQNLDAVKEGRVYNVIVGYYGWYPATAIINVMQIAKIAYPELFSDLDVEKEGNEIYKVMYGVDNFFTDLVDIYNLYVP